MRECKLCRTPKARRFYRPDDRQPDGLSLSCRHCEARARWARSPSWKMAHWVMRTPWGEDGYIDGLAFDEDGEVIGATVRVNRTRSVHLPARMTKTAVVS